MRRRLHNFERVYRLDRWFRRRFTHSGYLVLAGSGAGAILGIQVQLNLASQIFAFLTVILLLSVLSSLWFRPQLRIQRILPPFITATESAQYTLRIENKSRRTQHELSLIDELNESFPSLHEFRRWYDPSDQKRNRFDRYVGYPRWLGLVRHQQGALSPGIGCPVIPAGGQVEITLELIPQRYKLFRIALKRSLSHPSRLI